MNIKQFKKRTSVRDFTNEKLSKSDINDITDVINNSPTSTNGQQFSAIIITDDKNKRFISKKNWNQQHIIDSAAFILFVSDYSRNKAKNIGKHVGIHEFYRGIVDATIAATYAQDALITLGYGVTMVGGVMGFAEDLHELLNLPKETMVVVGLSVGKPSKINDFKPKANKVFMEKYDDKANMDEINRYNKELIDYYQKRNQNNDFINYQAEMLTSNESVKQVIINAGKYLENKLEKIKNR